MDLRLRHARLALLIAVALLTWGGGQAQAASPAPIPPESLPPKPGDYTVGARAATRVASAVPEVGAETAARGRLSTAIQTTDEGAWQVGFKASGEEVVQVRVDARTGAVREVWTGYQVLWPMARGYEGQFGHVLNAPYVWLSLAAIFLIGLVDWRRPGRVAHLDLLVLLGFGISQVFFNEGEIGVSVPLVYPLLAYLLARMLWLGFRGGEPLRPSVPVRALVVVGVALIAFRLTINLADSGVIDVGYAGTIGADRLTSAEAIWGEGVFPEDNRFGDTYGPANYLAYVPFEAAFPWSGEWDALPASHAAAIAFDLATVAGLLVCGMRLRPGRRGRELGVVLAFAWLAYPYTAFALQSNSNDALIAALLAWSLAFFAKPAARGALLAFAALAKFAPLVLVPLYAAGERGLADRWRERRQSGLAGMRPAGAFALAFALAAAVLLAHPAIDSGLATFFDRTVASQVDRTSPFSIWGQTDLGWLQAILFASCAALALLVAFVPRRRSIAQVAALSAALLIALQLSTDHWFYLYIPWFMPALLVALVFASPRQALTRAEPAP